LLGLPRKECKEVFPKLELVRLTLHQVLHESGDTLKSAYFCNSGMFSVLTVMPDGKTVEVGLIGKEGLSGIPLLAGFRTAFTRTVVQAEGTSYRIEAQSLRAALRRCPKLQRSLDRFAHVMAMQVAQIATCNRLHEADERLARWLLMTQDRVGTADLPLTQDFLSQMLGTRRSTVTVSAGTLQKAGLISYSRGRVTVLNRPLLEEAACDCYAVVQRQTNQWKGQDEL
jgi:CRP-like cAMP-binding protein